MNPDEPPRSDEICVVCGKDTAGGRGFMALHLAGRLIALCCPQCQKVYQENPSHHTLRQQTRESISDIEHKLGWHNPK